MREYPALSPALFCAMESPVVCFARFVITLLPAGKYRFFTAATFACIPCTVLFAGASPAFLQQFEANPGLKSSSVDAASDIRCPNSPKSPALFATPEVIQ